MCVFPLSTRVYNSYLFLNLLSTLNYYLRFTTSCVSVYAVGRESIRFLNIRTEIDFSSSCLHHIPIPHFPRITTSDNRRPLEKVQSFAFTALIPITLSPFFISPNICTSLMKYIPPPDRLILSLSRVSLHIPFLYLSSSLLFCL